MLAVASILEVVTTSPKILDRGVMGSKMFKIYAIKLRTKPISTEKSLETRLYRATTSQCSSDWRPCYLHINTHTPRARSRQKLGIRFHVLYSGITRGRVKMRKRKQKNRWWLDWKCQLKDQGTSPWNAYKTNRKHYEKLICKTAIWWPRVKELSIWDDLESVHWRDKAGRNRNRKKEKF